MRIVSPVELYDLVLEPTVVALKGRQQARLRGDQLDVVDVVYNSEDGLGLLDLNRCVQELV